MSQRLPVSVSVSAGSGVEAGAEAGEQVGSDLLSGMQTNKSRQREGEKVWWEQMGFDKRSYHSPVCCCPVVGRVD